MAKYKYKYKNKSYAKPKSTATYKEPHTLHLAMHKSLGYVFPDKLITYLEFTSLDNNTAAGSQLNYTYKGNDCYKCGPLINFAGTFGNNVPAGINFLWASNLVGGATAPYNQIVVLGSSIEASVYNYSAVQVPIQFTLLPTTNTSISGVGRTQVGELPYSKQMLMTPVAALGKWMKLTNSMTTKKMLGLTTDSYLDDDAYTDILSAGVSTGPILQNSWFWQVDVRACDSGNSAQAIDVQVRIKYRVEFRGRNNFNTTVPA